MNCPSCKVAKFRYDIKHKVAYCPTCKYSIDLETPGNDGTYEDN